MTSSGPEPQPGEPEREPGSPWPGQQPYPAPPQHGHPQHGHPQHGHPQHGQLPYGHVAHGQPQYGPPPYGPPGPGSPAPGSPGRPPQGPLDLDVHRVRVADWTLAVAAVLTLLCMVLSWDTGYFFAYNGFDVAPMTFGFVLLVLAALWTTAAWATDLRLQVPRGLVTVGLTGLALLMTLVAWLRTFADGFSVMAFVTLLVVAGAMACAVLGLVAERRARAAPAGPPTAPGSGPHPSGSWPPSAWPPAPWQPAPWQPAPWQPAPWQPSPWQPSPWQPPVGQPPAWQSPPWQGPAWQSPAWQPPSGPQPPPGGATAWRPPAGEDDPGHGRPGPNATGDA